MDSSFVLVVPRLPLHNDHAACSAFDFPDFLGAAQSRAEVGKDFYSQIVFSHVLMDHVVRIFVLYFDYPHAGLNVVNPLMRMTAWKRLMIFFSFFRSLF